MRKRVIPVRATRLRVVLILLTRSRVFTDPMDGSVHQFLAALQRELGLQSFAVCVDRAAGQMQLVSDLFYRLSLSEQSEDIEFPVRKAVDQRLVVMLWASRRLRQNAIDELLAKMQPAIQNLADGANDGGSGVLLIDIAVSSRAEHALAIDTFVVHRGNDDLGVRLLPFDPVDQIQPVPLLKRQIDDHHVGMQAVDELLSLRLAGRYTADFEIGFMADHQSQSFAHQCVILHDQNFDATAAVEQFDLTCCGFDDSFDHDSESSGEGRLVTLVPLSHTCSVAAVSEVTEALVGAEVVEGFSEEGPESFDGSRGLAADQPFEFREDQFDGVQVGTVRRQVDQGGSDGRDCLTDASDLVCGEVVHHHEIAGSQSWCELLLDVGQEQFTVHRTVDHQRRGQAVVTQRRDKGRRLPVAVRHLGDQALATTAAAITPSHVRAGPRLIQKHQATRIDANHLGLPGDPTLVDIGPILLRGAQDFF